METNFKELVSQYEALWENDAPREQIVEFCRQHLDEDETLFYILINSVKWGNMVVMPSFLKYLRDDDDLLLRELASYLRPRHGMNYNDIFVIVSRILSMKRTLSDKVRAVFWTVLKNIYRKLPISHYPYAGLLNEGCEDMTLVDNHVVRRAILKRKKKGYDLIPKGLFFLDNKRFIPLSEKALQALQLSEKMFQALQMDSVAMFEVALTLTGKKITTGLIRAILRASDYNIIVHLLKCRFKAVTAILPLQDLLICMVANHKDIQRTPEKTLAFFDSIVELFPGIIKSTDKLGNNLLWYCLYNKNAYTKDVAEHLIRNGCDPDARNHLNLSYNICKEFRDYEIF